LLSILLGLVTLNVRGHPAPVRFNVLASFEIRYTVRLVIALRARAQNSGGHRDEPHRWRVVPKSGQARIGMRVFAQDIDFKTKRPT
jgi:hypothetical protein